MKNWKKNNPVYFKQDTNYTFTHLSQLMFEFSCGSLHGSDRTKSSFSLSFGLKIIVPMFYFKRSWKRLKFFVELFLFFWGKYWQPKAIYSKLRELSTNNLAFIGLLDIGKKSIQAKKRISWRYSVHLTRGKKWYLDMLAYLFACCLLKLVWIRKNLWRWLLLVKMKWNFPLSQPSSFPGLDTAPFSLGRQKTLGQIMKCKYSPSPSIPAQDRPYQS